MYCAHFGLREFPFGLTPDTEFAFSGVAHQEALNVLLVASASGEGFIKITGEVGMGKTLLCRRFLATLDDDYVAAYIPNPMLEPRGLLLAIADEFDAGADRDADNHQIIKAVNHALLAIAEQGKKAFVFVDEAQAMPVETLEALRLLSNLETEKCKLLQVIMFGQPELDEKLGHPSIRQLNQRISFQHHLGGLSKEETKQYVTHRLQVAGYAGDQLFAPAAISTLFRQARGVPRLVNVIAHKALLAAYGEGKSHISKKHVVRAGKDTPAAAHGGRSPIAGLVAATVVAVGLTLWFFVI
jgi:MSHA biogenesis protein MshM